MTREADEPTDLRGASPALVRTALDTGDPLPGTAGFAGRVDDCLVRDVLGRELLFYDDSVGPGTDGGPDADGLPPWSFDPTTLDEPTPLPAGHSLDPVTGDESEASPVERWTLPEPEPYADDETALATVTDAVHTSVESLGTQAGDAGRGAGLAVAFSGGVDSALVAAGAPNAPCYVAGFEDCHDVAAARAAADAMDRDLRVVAFDHDDIVRAVPAVARATGRTNAMDVQIALPLYFVAEQAAADGYDRLAVGQGADELFGGYRKVVNPAEDHRVEADTVRGATREVLATLPAQLERDVRTLRAAGVEPAVPLLHDRVVDAALRLPGHLLATDDRRKVALRHAAEGLVPESVRSVEKKAVQYGTYAARELDRLARQTGFKRRMDDHVDRYVESLLAT